MKKQLLVTLLIITVMMLIPTIVSSTTVTLTKTGEWGGGRYWNVFVLDHYAYCAALGGGFDILDINDPANPQKLGGFTAGMGQFIWDVFVEGKYAYAVESHHLLVVDVSIPSAPVLVGSYLSNLLSDPEKVVVSGGYAYLSDCVSGFEIIDISNPRNPVQVARKNNLHQDLFVTGGYLYVASTSGLWIFDVSDPANPVHLSTAEFGNWIEHVWVSGNYAYADGAKNVYINDISNPLSPQRAGAFSLENYPKSLAVYWDHLYLADQKGVQVVDVSSPASPITVGNYTSGEIRDIYPKKGFLYTASDSRGLDVIDISAPGSPELKGSYNSTGLAGDVFIMGNYAYVANGENGLKVIDISDPASPKQVAAVPTGTDAIAVHGSGNYVYVAGIDSKVYVVDVSTPAAAKIAGTYTTGADVYDLVANGNYVYAAGGIEGLLILDVSNPAAPVKTGQFDGEGAIDVYRVETGGSYVYFTTEANEFFIIDVSDPANPKRVGDLDPGGFVNGMQKRGDYLYMIVFGKGLRVLDVSVPLSPVFVGEYGFYYGEGVCVSGDYVFVAGTECGILALDVSSKSSPVLVGSYDTAKFTSNIAASGNYLYAVGGVSGGMTILRISPSASIPILQLSRNQLSFATSSAAEGTGSQSFLLSNPGKGNLSWAVSSNRDWLTFTPSSGNNSGEVFVSVDGADLPPGTYHGAITVISPAADRSPQTVDVTLMIYGNGQTAAPFGEFATPGDGSTVRSSIPVTGWVLDDVGIQCVQIFREESGSLVFIGDAVFVEGARPDVEAAYPGYPNNHKAGWGYMMLTNYLPGGDGVYRIHAVATDVEGNSTDLGVKTITVNNAGAEKPFGAIDTPMEGGIASGSQYINFGWALTAQPNTIPTDGSTITVWVDGKAVGHPVYNQYREDIATFFPGLNNSDGAVGYFYLDTTSFQNGIHSIQWTATDDAGNTDGIGSRFVKIINPDPRDDTDSSTAAVSSEPLDRIPLDTSSPVQVRKGFNPDAPAQTVFPDENGVIPIQIRELERIEVHFGENAGKFTRELPLGCTWDSETGVLSWFPAHGFFGVYDFIMIRKAESRGKMKQHLRIAITARY